MGLIGNIRSVSIACWKARGRLPIVMIELFSSSYISDDMSKKSVDVGVC